MEDEWISAAEAYSRVSKVLPFGAAEAICSRANDEILVARAQTLIWGKERRENKHVPPLFWWARGKAALGQNWKSGDFETWINQRIHCRAYGVMFHAQDIEVMLPASKVAAPVDTVSQGGRPKSEHWTNWIAELAAYLHEEGLPVGIGTSGQDAVIGAIEERLINRNLECLSRSTVQPVVRAVLLRLRSAEN